MALACISVFSTESDLCVNFENMNNKCVIYFKQKTTSKYEEKLLGKE